MGRTKSTTIKNTKNPQSKRQRTSEEGSSRSTPATWFWNDTHAQRFNSLLSKSIALGMAINSTFLRDQSFRNIDRLFGHQDWLPFLDIYSDFDTTMIRQFYANFRQPDAQLPNFETIVYGQRLSITPYDILSFLYPDCDPFNFEGVQIIHANFDKYYQDYSPEQALISVHDPACTNFTSTSVIDLSLENRLIHHVISHTITPRSGTFSSVNPLDVGIMFLIQNRVKINIAYLILFHILRCASSSHSSLPYGMFLTKFLIEYKAVKAVRANMTTPDLKHQTYTSQTLALLFKYSKQTATWIRRYPLSQGAEQQAPQDDDPQQEERNQEDLPSDVPGSSSAPPQRDLYEMLSSRFDRIDAANAAILSANENILNRIGHLEENFQNLTNRFDNLNFWQPPPQND